MIHLEKSFIGKFSRQPLNHVGPGGGGLLVGHFRRNVDKVVAVDSRQLFHFPLFDWIFETYHMPDDRWPDGYGVASEPVPAGYWKQFLYPFTRMTPPESE